MNDLTIPDLTEPQMSRLRTQAASKGRSPEEEARDILAGALSEPPPAPKNLAEAIHARFASIGGWDMPEIPREPMREPPDFSDWREE